MDRGDGFGERGCPGSEPDNFGPGKPLRADFFCPLDMKNDFVRRAASGD